MTDQPTHDEQEFVRKTQHYFMPEQVYAVPQARFPGYWPKPTHTNNHEHPTIQKRLRTGRKATPKQRTLQGRPSLYPMRASIREREARKRRIQPV